MIPLGTVLHYMKDGQVHAVRIKDHGTTAVKGEFFLITSIVDEDRDDSSRDMEVALDEMELILNCMVQG